MRDFSQDLPLPRRANLDLSKTYPEDLACMIGKYSGQVLSTVQLGIEVIQQFHETVANWKETKNDLDLRLRQMKIAQLTGDEPLYKRSLTSAQSLIDRGPSELNTTFFLSEQEKLIYTLDQRIRECYYQSEILFQSSLYGRGLETISGWTALHYLRACLISSLAGEHAVYHSSDQAVQSYTSAYEAALKVVKKTHPLARQVEQRLNFCRKIQNLNDTSF